MNAQCSRLFIVLLLLASGCGPTVIRAPELSQTKLRTLALLPTKVPADVRRERAKYLRTALRRELQSSGYILLEDPVVEELCGGAECPNRAAIASRYPVDGFVDFALGSMYRANFLAGYVNTIAGTVTLLDRRSNTLFSVEHTENEKGGLLFNSGQVIEGLRSTTDNAGDDSFNKLADRFVKSVSSRFPAPATDAPLRIDPKVTIATVDTRSEGGGRYQVCVHGTAGGHAVVLIDRTHAPLREVRSGDYCGTYLLGGLVRTGSNISVELRSAYGSVDRRPLEAAPFMLCNVSGLVHRSGTPTLSFGCSRDGDSLAGADCEQRLQQCRGAELIVFRGAGESGPFERVGVIKNSSFTDASPAGNDPVYAVVAVSPGAGQAAPLTVATATASNR